MKTKQIINGAFWATAALALCAYAICYGVQMEYKGWSVAASCLLQTMFCYGGWRIVNETMKRTAERRRRRLG